jgi:HD-GYP domain-containing protein (c-di-GMP phosphodiesterase class II)/sensor domain CHASE-containing protein
MTLRKKTLFLISLTLIGLMVAVYITSAALFLGSFAKLEKQDTSRNVERVRRALSNTLVNLNIKAADWAMWDDTYRFIEDANDAYVKSNLVPLAFTELGLNLALFINSSGRIVFGSGFDLKNQKATPIPERLQEHLSAGGLLLQHPDIKSSLTGIILLPEYPMLIVSRPILTSEGKGPSRGSVIFGRYLDDAEIKRISEVTQLSFTVHSFKEAQMLPDFQIVSSSLSEKAPIYARPLSADTIVGYTMLSDIYKKPALLLRVHLSRPIYQQGQSTRRYLILWFLAVGLVFGTVTLLLLEKGVLSRLARLSTCVGSISSSGNSSARVSLGGSDELSGLAGSINVMLEALENSQHDLRKAHDELEIRVQERTAELVKANERIQLHLQRLGALYEIDRAITASLDLRFTLKVLLEQVTSQLGVHASIVLVLNRYTQMLEYAAALGFRSSAIQNTRLLVGEGHAGRIALEQCVINIPNLAEFPDGFSRSPLLKSEKFITYYGAPLIAKGRVMGVLELFHRVPFDFDPECLNFLNTIAAQAAIAIDNAKLFNNLQRSNIELTLAYNATLEGWSRALDMRDKETEGHSQRVTEITLCLARAMGLKEEELVNMCRGALLHDIGKIGIPDTILLKPGPLNDEEWEIMRKHPVYSYELLAPISFLRQALEIPYCHHEKWDGTGYPRGLKGEQIPLAARIFAVVDVWESLLSDRPYRPAWPKENVREYIRSLAGTHFDPKVLEVFFEMGS